MGDDDMGLNELIDKTVELEASLEGVKDVQIMLGRLHANCEETKARIHETALQLMSKIQEHETCLMEEVVDFQETQYRVLGIQNGEQISDTVSRMETVLDQATRTIQDLRNDDVDDDTDRSRRRISQITTTITDFQTKNSLSKSCNGVSYFDTKRVVFHPVRCNTSFGIVEVSRHENGIIEEDEVKQMKRRSGSLGMISNRAVSIPVLCANPKVPGFHRSPTDPSFNQIPAGGNRVVDTAGSLSSEKPAIRRRMSVQMMAPVSQQALLAERVGQKQGGHDSGHDFRASPGTAELLWRIDNEGQGERQINCPNDVVFSLAGNLVISDRDNKRLQVVDVDGNFMRCLGEGKIKPCRLAVCKDGGFAVTDSSENCVKVFSSSGHLQSPWGKKKPLFKTPCGIVINSKSQSIIADLDRRAVSIYGSNYKHLCELSYPGGHIVDFASPSYLAVDSNDRIVVSDSWSHSVKVFDKEGKFLLDFGKFNGNPACKDTPSLKYPNGVACTRNGNIIVADWGSHSVSEFASNGQFIRHLVTKNDGLQHPAGIAIHDKLLAVTEYSDSHSAVTLFKLHV